jgi:hypothetical protein
MERNETNPDSPKYQADYLQLLSQHHYILGHTSFNTQATTRILQKMTHTDDQAMYVKQTRSQMLIETKWNYR